MTNREQSKPIGREDAERKAERRMRHADCRRQLAALLEGEEDPIARLASAAALIREAVPRASFVGFYRAVGDGLLVIGPYQGPPACLRISYDRGVCGAAAREGRSILIDSVEDFPGHIACDPLARSELVVPVRDGKGRLAAVLDLDSREPAAFDELDRGELEETVRLLLP